MIYPKEVEDLLKDNFSGSASLLEKLNQILKANEKIRNDDTLLLNLKNEFQEFAVIENHFDKLLEIPRDKRLKFIKEEVEKSSQLINSIYQNFIKEVNPNKILTISNSFTLHKVFEKYFEENKNLEITVCESRPILEGRILAENLASLGIKINLITEAQIANSIEKCDCAVTGADKILKNGNVINKTGSKLIALLCAYYQKPFYVLSSKSKIVNTSAFQPNIKNVNEIYSTTNNLIQITNYYFEEINSSLITKIITD